MSILNISKELDRNPNIKLFKAKNNHIKLLDKTLELTPSLAVKLTKKVIQKVIELGMSI